MKRCSMELNICIDFSYFISGNIDVEMGFRANNQERILG